MTTARVYKVKIRDNVLRQMIFTDVNIAIGLVVFVSLVFWLLSKELPLQARIFGCMIVSGFLLLGLSAKVDRQPSYVVLKRTITYIFRKKSIRY